ncbi:alkaline phosphatase [Arcticibacterium luteifluviistationis]|uniref:Alkaline phosphatase n=1 Tax=Arcticibacterium luteifluviistationis TaxID=1784714 RepID=A0A2Z4GDX5_9BACT|nr:alkaline phosphatase [Arcticibacterium luteifluviistationis]AWV99198.1 alkaline phosphatase [Arcticibacterium luteifluviistationis]
MKILKILTLLLASGSLFAQEKPKNVILLVGDGMGLSQISTAFYYKDGPSNFEQFKNIGFIKTSSTSSKVTDSAAGATAFASGKKTYNGAIGVDADTLSIPTIVEELDAINFKTGLISLSTITHATPACFYAHVKSRNMHEEIAEQLAHSQVDFFAGAGLQYFTQRSDKKNLFKEMKLKGYQMDSIGLATSIEPGKKYGFISEKEALPAKHISRGDFHPKATQLALDYLSQSKDGFFLMSEGSFIDWAGHQNNAEMLVAEQLDFDEVLGVVLDFAKKDKNTLVVVTADHETGGVALTKGKTSDELSLKFNTKSHTAALIPIFAYGPGSETFQGIYENNEVYHKIKQLLAL